MRRRMTASVVAAVVLLATVIAVAPVTAGPKYASERRALLTHRAQTMRAAARVSCARVRAARAMPCTPRNRVDLWLTILHNNDGESKLIDLGGDLTDFGGAARFKSLADDLKWKATHGPRSYGQRGAKRGVLMVSSGDNFLAGAEFNVSLEKGVPFYDTIAMDLIGYDAIAIGNHDFDFGPDVFADFIAGYQYTKPPYVSSNLDFSEEPNLQYYVDQGRIAKSTVVKERGDKIGVIGATTPNLPFISSPRDVQVDADVAAAILGEVDRLKKCGINKIVLISHLQSIEEDLELIPLLDDVDVVVAGGGDEVLANEGDLLVPGDETEVYGPYPMEATDVDGTKIPVVTTAGDYAYVGRLVVGFDKWGRVVDLGKNSGPMRVAGDDYPDAVDPDPKVLSMVTDPLTAALADLAADEIATSEVALDGRRTSVRTMETNEGNLIADSLLWEATVRASDYGQPVPDIALQNGGGIRNNNVLPAGPITALDTFSMVPFPNFVSIVPDVSRDTLKAILENAVSRVEFGDGRFAQVAGFRYTWDPSGTAMVIDDDGNVTTEGTRVTEVVLDDGTQIVSAGAVVPGPAVTVATIDFLARGGDKYPFGGAEFTTVGVTYQQALANYLTDALAGEVTAADYPEGGEGRITEE
jgi:2',3'-cyclic-nucleotide 2'-phosphodiesterase (5'-nucleotidase family)